MSAFGYVRVSRMDAGEERHSPKVQEERIRALAKAAGHDDVVVLEDINVSGKEVERRPGYLQLVEAIERDDATLVLAWDLSRLHRNRREAERFWDLVREHGTEVRFVDGMSVDPKSATGRMFLSLFNTINAWVSEVSSEKIRASLARREQETGRRNGNKPYGSLPGEDVSVVVAAFDDAQSFEGAAKLLNDRGVPARGKKASETSTWYGSSVRDILRRHDPDRFVDPKKAPRGVRAGVGPFNLSRLLVCGQCGGMMSASVDQRNGDVRYGCSRARVVPHGRGMVSEKVLLPAILDEADHVRTVARHSTIGSTEDDEKRAALLAKRSRIIDLAADGMIDKAEARRRLDEVDDAMRGLRALRNVLRLPLPPVMLREVLDDGTVVEPDPPARVNAWLRSVFASITVDSMRDRALRGPSREPVRLSFDWRDPSLRSEAAAAAS